MVSAIASNTGNTVAPPPSLVVQFQTMPLFQEVNFAPGNSVARWVKVTNNTNQSKQVQAKATNIIDNNALSAQINLLIKTGVTTIYTGTLKGFFDAGEMPLTSIGANTTLQYDFMATFNTAAGNAYQGKTVGFDLIVGFKGQDQGNIVIIKKTIGGNDTFGFTGSLGQFNITTVNGTGTAAFSLPVGTHTVTEPNDLKGWTLVSVTCTDPTNDSNPNNRNAVIKLSANETVTCTFTNKKK